MPSDQLALLLQHQHQQFHHELREENLILRQRLAKLQVNMDNTRRLLDEERKINRELRCEKVDVASSRNELELFFLECVDEVKREISKRLDKQQLKQKYSSRSTKAVTATSGQADLQDDDSQRRIKAKQFQGIDKQRVIELLMENDQVLLFLYEKLFPQTSLQSNTKPLSRLASARVIPLQVVQT